MGHVALIEDTKFMPENSMGRTFGGFEVLYWLIILYSILMELVTKIKAEFSCLRTESECGRF
jgi:hypothetical protein